MPRTLLDPATYRHMAWKNGGGTTTELALAPVADNPGRFLWRVSIADVSRPGPFSTFDGCERLIAVVGGAGMRLTIDGSPVVVRNREPALRFSGDAAVDCALLDGPIRDFNLIVDRQRTDGQLDLVLAGHRADVPAAGVALIHALDGAVAVHASDGVTTHIPAGWTLRLDDEGGTVEPEADACAVVARVAIR